MRSLLEPNDFFLCFDVSSAEFYVKIFPNVMLVLLLLLLLLLSFLSHLFLPETLSAIVIDLLYSAPSNPLK